ncbi:hypothetical protein [Geomobilimonas luticola]|uniref:PsbP C-terminal domain-containing protein n=1 Tax=Geomobilimonas luticola TaxID=1114878 RepID=A0ABS5SEZ2_9BACT|nr:hypothetical protein [Geomobilimonas luticola]MBT0653084.1 hypothetical protein [Geomobilimonas luticola]
MTRHFVRKALVGTIGLFVALLGLTVGDASAAGEYRPYVMDGSHFSCEIPTDWDLTRDEEKDEEYRIYGILLTKESGASIDISFYAADNEDFNGHKDFLKRNSTNILGETKNSREQYGPVKKVQLKGGQGFGLERERLVYLSPQSKSDASEALKELLYVLPAATGGFYVLHYSAPRELFQDSLPVFRRVADSFVPRKLARQVSEE